MLEATPDTAAPTGLASVVPLTNDLSTKREKLAILVSTGKSKEAIGVQLTHDQVKRLSDKEVEKYSKRQEAYIGSKTTESLIDSFLMLELQKELKNDYIINQELSNIAGGMALRCGRWLALANAALITTKHIQLEPDDTQTTTQTTTHPSRDSEGYPLEGVDEVC